MSDTFKVRIGVASARELELEVSETQIVIDAYTQAVKTSEPVLWVTDARGHRFGIAVQSIAFIEFDKPQERGVGFGRS
ncbi:MAG: DUF3107 family protein [Acidimicrobiia bacterium]|jgi:hypothetical protein